MCPRGSIFNFNKASEAFSRRSPKGVVETKERIPCDSSPPRLVLPESRKERAGEAERVTNVGIVRGVQTSVKSIPSRSFYFHVYSTGKSISFMSKIFIFVFTVIISYIVTFRKHKDRCNA